VEVKRDHGIFLPVGNVIGRNIPRFKLQTRGMEQGCPDRFILLTYGAEDILLWIEVVISLYFQLI
jgi:hypothetical protein